MSLYTKRIGPLDSQSAHVIKCTVQTRSLRSSTSLPIVIRMKNSGKFYCVFVKTRQLNIFSLNTTTERACVRRHNVVKCSKNVSNVINNRISSQTNRGIRLGGLSTTISDVDVPTKTTIEEIEGVFIL